MPSRRTIFAETSPTDADKFSSTVDNLTINQLSTTNKISGSIECLGSVQGVIGTYMESTSFKKDVKNIDIGLKEILKIRPISFIWNENTLTPSIKDVGFVSEELKEILPQIVTDSQIKYHGLIAILVKAIQEQQVLIDEKKVSIQALQKDLQDAKKS